MKNKHWILIFAGFAVFLSLFLLIPRGGDEIGIFQDGTLMYRLTSKDLSETRELRLFYEAGETVIHAGPDGVWIVSADCPNKDCVRQGPLRRSGPPIVCLPERIVIRRMDGDGELDAVSR